MNSTTYTPTRMATRAGSRDMLTGIPCSAATLHPSSASHIQMHPTIATARWAYRTAPTFWKRYSEDRKREVRRAPTHPNPAAWPDTGLHAAWLGHTTVLLKVDGITILTDPVFSARVGLNFGPLTVGIKRLVAPAFRSVRSSRPFDLAIMPVGAYDPWIHYHCTPEQAWQMANDAGAEFVLPVHHQTFALSSEPYLEPISRLYAAAGNQSERVALDGIGQEFQIA